MYKQFKHLRLIFLAGVSTLAFVAIPMSAAFAVELVEEAQWFGVSEYDNFGYSVSTDGTTVVIGAVNEGEDQKGGAYVYRRDGDTWSGPQRLVGDEWRARFGCSVSVDGSTMVIGDYRDYENGANAGAAYIFEYDGNNWNQTMKWTGESEGDYFGYSVDIDGDTVVIGTDTGTDTNSVYVYERDGDTWSAPYLLTSGFVDDYFGRSVSVGGDWLIVGAAGDDQAANNAGAAYVYQLDCSAWSES